VIACGYVFSRKTLNDVVSRGPGSRGTNLVLENPKEWLSRGGQVYAEPGLEDKPDWADRW
jgi:hypothetical protein